VRAWPPRGPHSQLQAFCISHRSPDPATTDDLRRFQLHLAEAREHRTSQPLMTGLSLLVPGDTAESWIFLRPISYHIRAGAEYPLVMSRWRTRRAPAAVASNPVRTLSQSRLCCGPARQRGWSAQGQATSDQLAKIIRVEHSKPQVAMSCCRRRRSVLLRPMLEVAPIALRFVTPVAERWLFLWQQAGKFR